MSSDNGWLLRKNTIGKYVLQHYMASAPHWPSIDTGSLKFDTLEEAISAYQDKERKSIIPSEYGLTVRI